MIPCRGKWAFSSLKASSSWTLQGRSLPSRLAGYTCPAPNLSGASGSASLNGFNNLDQFTGQLCDSVTCHGFSDKNGVFTKFDPPGASFTSGQGINDWGQVDGYFADSEGGLHGFVDTNGHFTTIDDPKAFVGLGTGTEPLAINDLGQIAGWYYDAEANIHAFLATPNLLPFALTAAAPLAETVPEPSTWVMTLLGFAGLGFARYCRARTGHATLAE